jgi:hypothetical protein
MGTDLHRGRSSCLPGRGVAVGTDRAGSHTRAGGGRPARRGADALFRSRDRSTPSASRAAAPLHEARGGYSSDTLAADAPLFISTGTADLRPSTRGTLRAFLRLGSAVSGPLRNGADLRSRDTGATSERIARGLGEQAVPHAAVQRPRDDGREQLPGSVGQESANLELRRGTDPPCSPRSAWRRRERLARRGGQCVEAIDAQSCCAAANASSRSAGTPWIRASSTSAPPRPARADSSNPPSAVSSSSRLSSSIGRSLLRPSRGHRRALPALAPGTIASRRPDVCHRSIEQRKSVFDLMRPGT